MELISLFCPVYYEAGDKILLEQCDKPSLFQVRSAWLHHGLASAPQQAALRRMPAHLLHPRPCSWVHASLPHPVHQPIRFLIPSLPSNVHAGHHLQLGGPLPDGGIVS